MSFLTKMKIWPLWWSVLLAKEPPWPLTLRITLNMRMGGMWCMRTSLLIIFGKFGKKFGRPDSKEKKLLGECISYILPLVNASPPPPTYYRTGRNLFWTSPGCWRHKTSNVSRCLQSTRIIVGWRRMGHMHAGSMYQSRLKKAKESLLWLLLFYSPLNPKVLWEKCWDNMSHDTWHWRIMNGGTTKDAYNDTLLLFEAKLVLTKAYTTLWKCRNPTLRQVWGWDSHSQKWEFGVLWDSCNFRAQLQRSKHLALRCSLYRWKGLEAWMLKMALHEPFGHLKHKLWSKEGSGVAIWLPTTKSQELTRS